MTVWLVRAFIILWGIFMFYLMLGVIYGLAKAGWPGGF